MGTAVYAASVTQSAYFRVVRTGYFKGDFVNKCGVKSLSQLFNVTFHILELGHYTAFPIVSVSHLPVGGSCHGCLVGCDCESLIYNT